MFSIVRLVVVLLLFLCASSLANHFDGAWQLVKGEYVNGEGKLVDYADAKMNAIKTLSQGHYTFISMSGDKFWAAGAGSYNFTDDKYTETPIHTSYQSTAGGQYQFSYEIKGDYWHNSRFKDGKRVEYEVWQKLN